MVLPHEVCRARKNLSGEADDGPINPIICTFLLLGTPLQISKWGKFAWLTFILIHAS